jgi:hypothetical protein
MSATGKKTETQATPAVLAGCGDPACKGLNCGSIVCGLPLRPGSCDWHAARARDELADEGLAR